ncbi:unnamed protein product [Ectocarpus fasciculatus]
MLGEHKETLTSRKKKTLKHYIKCELEAAGVEARAEAATEAAAVAAAEAAAAAAAEAAAEVGGGWSSLASPPGGESDGPSEGDQDDGNESIVAYNTHKRKRKRKGKPNIANKIRSIGACHAGKTPENRSMIPAAAVVVARRGLIGGKDGYSGACTPGAAAAVGVGSVTAPSASTGGRLVTGGGAPVPRLSFLETAAKGPRPTAPAAKGLCLRLRLQNFDPVKIAGFTEFFQNVFGKTFLIGIDEPERLVKIWETSAGIAGKVARYMEYAIRVCGEGPWQPTDFSLVQLTLRAHGEESHRLPSLPVLPRPKRLRTLSAVHGVVAGTVNLDDLRTQTQSSPGIGAVAGLGAANGAQHRGDGLPQCLAPPRARGTVVQLWGLHHSVQAATDCLISRTFNKPQFLPLGRPSVDHLKATGWFFTMKASGVQVTPHVDGGGIWMNSPKNSVSLIMNSLEGELPRSVKLVDMVDAAVMRNVAAPAQLDNLVMMGGGVHGQIKIIPVREILCVLVLAPSEHALKVTAGNVCRAVKQWTENHVRVALGPKAANDPMLRLRGSQIKQTRGEDCTDFAPPFVTDLSREVSIFCVDLWLDGLCLRGRVRDGTSKTAAEAALKSHIQRKYPKFLPDASTGSL